MSFASVPDSWIQVGSILKQLLFQTIKDNLDYLYSAIGGAATGDVPNGSFDIDSDGDGAPDSWTGGLYPGGSAGLYTTNPGTGTKARSYTHPGGSGNGGGYDDSDYLPCSEKRTYCLSWLIWATTASIKCQVIIRFYDKAKSYLSSTTIYDSTSNPTSQTMKSGSFIPVADARFFKIRAVGGESSVDVAGTVYFDDFRKVDAGAEVIAGQDDGFVAGGSGGLYIDGVETSGLGDSGAQGFKMNVLGGRDVVVKYASSGYASVILPLPAGVWMIYGSTHFYYIDPDSYCHLVAYAIRQA